MKVYKYGFDIQITYFLGHIFCRTIEWSHIVKHFLIFNSMIFQIKLHYLSLWDISDILISQSSLIICLPIKIYYEKNTKCKRLYQIYDKIYILWNRQTISIMINRGG